MVSYCVVQGAVGPGAVRDGAISDELVRRQVMSFHLCTVNIQLASSLAGTEDANNNLSADCGLDPLIAQSFAAVDSRCSSYCGVVARKTYEPLVIDKETKVEAGLLEIRFCRGRRE